MKADSISSPSRKKTIRAVVIGIIAVIVGVYCFREQLELCALNSTCNTLLSNQNTITEENVEFYLYPLVREMSLKWKNEHNFEFKSVGTGSLGESLNLIGVDYNKEDPLNINEARALLIQCASELLDRVNEHEKLRSELSVHPFTSKNLRFGISFLKEHKHPPKGKLSWLSLYEGGITYYTHNPDAGKYGQYEILFEETYDEALNIISQSALHDTL